MSGYVEWGFIMLLCNQRNKRLSKLRTYVCFTFAFACVCTYVNTLNLVCNERTNRLERKKGRIEIAANIPTHAHKNKQTFILKLYIIEYYVIPTDGHQHRVQIPLIHVQREVVL